MWSKANMKIHVHGNGNKLSSMYASLLVAST